MQASASGVVCPATRKPVPTTVSLPRSTLEDEQHAARRCVIADPTIAYLLMMAGLLGLYIEFTHPGVLFPGVARAI